MMSFLAFLVTGVCVALTAMQAFYVIGYRTWLRQHRARPRQTEGQYAPPAAIVLCLKGADPSLTACLAGLVKQDYSDFQLFVVVDCLADPAALAVADFFADQPIKPTVLAIEHPALTCSLKCSALTQAIGAIPSSLEVIAFIDADTVPDPRWLSDLVTPLGDRQVGATTGNRWFTPHGNQLGTWVRKIWNAAAVVQMQRYEIPWGGSFAMRAATIERCGLVEHWRHTFCEDTSMVTKLQQQGLSVQRVADLILENTETTTLAGALEWITRQLLTVRLHHPRWSWVMAHAVASGIVAIGGPMLIGWGLWTGQATGVGPLVIAYSAWQVINTLLLWIIERLNVRALQSRAGFSRPSVPQTRRWRSQILGTLVTQWIYPFAAFKAAGMAKVRWRGVTYRLGNNARIELVQETDAARADGR